MAGLDPETPVYNRGVQRPQYQGGGRDAQQGDEHRRVGRHLPRITRGRGRGAVDVAVGGRETGGGGGKSRAEEDGEEDGETHGGKIWGWGLVGWAGDYLVSWLGL